MALSQPEQQVHEGDATNFGCSENNQETMELELGQMLKQESMSPQQASPLQLLVLMVCSLGPAFFPTIWRFLTDCEDVFFRRMTV